LGHISLSSIFRKIKVLDDPDRNFAGRQERVVDAQVVLVMNVPTLPYTGNQSLGSLRLLASLPMPLYAQWHHDHNHIRETFAQKNNLPNSPLYHQSCQLITIFVNADILACAAGCNLKLMLSDLEEEPVCRVIPVSIIIVDDCVHEADWAKIQLTLYWWCI
jgi:hypothetical protein